MELVVVIAIIGILAGIAVPRFLDATASARGAKIVADMRTLQSAEMVYYAKFASYPTGDDDTAFKALIQGGFPTPPNGKFSIARVLNTGGASVGETSSANGYIYTVGNATDHQTPGTVTVPVTAVTAGTGETAIAAGNVNLTTLLGGTVTP